MVKILVTGGLGQLGQELRGLAASENFSWFFTDFGELDIADPEAVESLFARERPDVAVNCAAWTDVDGAENDPQGAFRVNMNGPQVLARVAARLGTALIHISTDFVFDGLGHRPYTEYDEPRPLNVYGKSKLAGEQAVLESGCCGAIIRTSWLYSPYGRNFVKSILEAASKKTEIRVVSDQWGSPTAAAGLAGAIVRMIPGLVCEPHPAEMYNYCGSGVASRSEFAAEIVRQAGLDCKVVPVASSEYPMVAARPAYSALDTSKIERTFGIIPRCWQDELSDCLNCSAKQNNH